MTPPRGPVRWLDRLRLARPKPEESVAWEIEHHIAELVDRLVEQGWERASAEREAERRFGDRTRYEPSMKRMEEGRVAMERRTRGWDVVREGIVSVVRTARRYPGFTAGVVVTLGLGIGANATMYGVVDRLLLQPPEHIEDHERVKRVFGERPSFITGEMALGSSMTYPDYADLRAHGGIEVAGFTYASEVTVGRGEGAERLERALATASFFPVLGVQPRLGRFYTEEESAVGAPLTGVISEEYWTREHGGDPDVLGRTLQVAGKPVTIVGVAPEGFTGTELAPVDLWMPLEASRAADNGEGCMNSRGCWWMQTVGRLGDGVTPDAAAAEATALHRNGRREMIEQDRYSDRARMVLVPIIAAQGPNASDEALVARWLVGVSLIVLLIACANVANLLMARGVRMRREIGVRLALGASRGRVVGQTMIEAVLLAGMGGVLALVLARWGGGIVRSTLLPGVHFPNESWSGRLLLFTGLATLLAGLFAGIAPALQGRRTDVSGSLIDGSRGSSETRSRLRGTLTVAQAAMSVVLLVGAGLFVRSLGELRSLDLGLDVDRLVLAQLELEDQDIEPADQTALYEEAARIVARLPDVSSASATAVPFQWGLALALEVPGVDSIPRLPGGGPYYFPISPGYFETVGLEVVRGRAFKDSDGAESDHVVVVSETMARLLWPETGALGQCLMVGDEPEQCTTVVGVVEDAARGGYQDAEFMAYYLPSAQRSEPHNGLYVRAGSPGEAVDEIAAVLRTFTPRVRFATARPLRETLDPQARAWTLGATMFSIFGLLALGLAAIGLYSVLAFDVAQRTRELGIRTALGAHKGALLRSVLVQGGRLTVLGIVLGGLAAWGAAPYVGDLLFQVEPRDPWTLIGVAVVLLVVSTAASLVPGMRATSVDPLEALRYE